MAIYTSRKNIQFEEQSMNYSVRPLTITQKVRRIFSQGFGDGPIWLCSGSTPMNKKNGSGSKYILKTAPALRILFKRALAPAE